MANQQRIEIKISGPQYDFYRSQKARNLFLVGQGGGKTFCIGFLSHLLVSTCPRALGLLAANTYGQLSDSTLLEVTKVWETLGWTRWTKGNPDGFYVIDVAPPASFAPHGMVFKTNANKIFFKNGAVIMLASLDNFKNIEGRTISWALLDETADTKEKAVKEVITGRLRGPGMHINMGEDRHIIPFVMQNHPTAGDQINPLYIFSKPAKEQWLTDMFGLEEWRSEIQETIYSKTDYFFKEYGNKCVVIASAYHNVPNVPLEYIANREKELSLDQAQMLIYGSPFGKSGAEYYANFDRRIHVPGQVQFTPGYPLHFTLDFNVNPYMSGQIWQLVPNGGQMNANCIREYAFTSPKNTIEHVCRTVLAEFGHLADHGFYFYGDATGKANLPIESVRDYYKIVERELEPMIYSTSRRLLKQNPRHRSISRGSLGRREFMNGILAGAYGINVQIDVSCKHTISDFEFVLEDANGAKLKKDEEINGIKCQKYGHMSDAADAFICYNFGNYKKEKQSHGQIQPDTTEANP